MRLRGLRRRLSVALGAAEELAQVREELAAVRAAYARDAALFVAHRAEWDRERQELRAREAELLAAGLSAGARGLVEDLLRARDTFRAMARAGLRHEAKVIELDERRAR
ncbi:hypothetical protein [Pseudonocardia sp. NPDC049635]|uniref:hypothetical protein n=1 Tax=Pseudonocardia sp. NPDC049635 TaxID=3155506 RepID=UPI0033DBF6A6